MIMKCEILYYNDERCEPHYRDADDRKCYWCGSETITHHAPDWDDERVDIPTECERCGREWHILLKIEKAVQ